MSGSQHDLHGHVLLETGITAMTEPITELVLEATPPA